MSLFLSTYINSLDKKSRVSVPAQFRAILNAQSFAGFVAYNSIKNNCIEACSLARLEKISANIDALDPYSEEHDAFSTTILGGAQQLGFDKDGRVTLTNEIVEFANLKDKVCFVGKGQVFEIWNPDDFAIHKQEAIKLAAEKKQMLKNIRNSDRD